MRRPYLQVQLDDFYFQYMTRDSVILEVNRRRFSTFEKMGSCSIHLLPLCRNKGVVVCNDIPILDESGGVVGHLSVELRVAVPLAQSLQVFLDANPDERERVQLLQDKMDAEDRQHRSNLQKALAPAKSKRTPTHAINHLEVCLTFWCCFVVSYL